MASSSNSPCAACKFLRRKCQPECVFAPYFPPDQPQKFANVHKVFGASNVTKLLNELLPHQREDAVNSLAYEADMRLRDPVYGCVGVISLLQHQLRQLQIDVNRAKSELAKYQSQLGLGVTCPHGAIAAAPPHDHHQIVGGGSSGSDWRERFTLDHHINHLYHQQQLFPGDQNNRHPRMINGEASRLLSMNISMDVGQFEEQRAGVRGNRRQTPIQPP